MAHIPEHLKNAGLPEFLFTESIQRVSSGKVRDTFLYMVGALLMFASNRISIFDFVLSSLVNKKGEVLTALTHFWICWLSENVPGFKHHLICSASTPKFNAAYDIRNDEYIDLPVERCLLVKDLTEKLYPFEMIFRHHIGGSVFKKYQETSVVGGQILPAGLPKWAKLSKPLFTPSTKEAVGHDINVDAQYFYQEMEKKGLGEEAFQAVNMLSNAYSKAYAYAEERGILILDTKFEVAGPRLVDEILTPDSSRFTLKEDWEKTMVSGGDQYFYDKQLVRDWGSKVPTPFEDEKGKIIIGINKLDPKNVEHILFVDKLEVPMEILEETTRRYLKIFQLLTGQTLADYQQNEMGV